MLRKIGFSVAIALLAGSVQAQTVLTKSPDLGPFWNPLNPVTGTWVYADCFIAPAGVDIWPHNLGTWLNQTPPPPTIRFEIWGDTGGSGPNAANVLATTGSISPNPTGLELISAPVQAGAQSLVPGTLYWFAATVVGESGTGSYQVGGHTQNSGGIIDNCTFWFSNDPGGIVFDGQNLTPEMAFTVTLDDVPVPVELMSFTIDG